MKDKYFNLNAFCKPVFGKKRSAIYNTLDGDIFWLDEVSTVILKNLNMKIEDIISKCKILAIKEEIVEKFFIEVRELKIGNFSDKKIFNDSIFSDFKRYNYKNELVDLKRVSIKITNKCDLNCYFCNSSQNKICFPCSRQASNGKRVLSNNDIKKIIDDVKLFECDEVIFTGGDPFKENEKILEVLEYAVNKIPNIYVFTNLSSISADQKKEICSISNIHLLVPLFSPDESSFKSISRKDNAFNIIINNIAELKSKKVKMTILFFKKKDDYDMSSIEYLLKNRSDYSFISPTPLSKDESFLRYFNGYSIDSEDSFGTNLHSFFENNLYNVCLGRRITVDLNGDIKPCFFSKTALGNIFEGSLKKLLRSGIQDHLWHLTKDRIDECKDCEFRYCCKHDCVVISNYINGKIDSKYPYCNYDPQYGIWKNKKGE